VGQPNNHLLPFPIHDRALFSRFPSIRRRQMRRFGAGFNQHWKLMRARLFSAGRERSAAAVAFLRLRRGESLPPSLDGHALHWSLCIAACYLIRPTLARVAAGEEKGRRAAPAVCE